MYNDASYFFETSPPFGCSPSPNYDDDLFYNPLDFLDDAHSASSFANFSMDASYSDGLVFSPSYFYTSAFSFGHDGYYDNDDTSVEDQRHIFCQVMHGTVSDSPPRKKRRRTKVTRDRESPWTFVCSWDDTLFARQMRLPRPVFFALLERLKLATPNYHLSLLRGKASTPGSGPITLELKLCVTLRILGGGAFVDMIWYGIQLPSVNPIFVATLRKINEVLTDSEIFNFHPSNPNFRSELDTMANEFAAISFAKHGTEVGVGGDCGRTVLAGDGLVVPITKPTKKELNGREASIFRNRKGCWGLIVAAFCDAYCRFRYFEVSWPGR